jgi:predicted dehydrogenase/threonine dehydrogenase-like Zn-dependent dehydrogenase
MKQVLQNLGNGEISVADVPCPSASRGSILIRTTASLVSAGTERMLLEFGRGSLLSKMRQQPDKVKQVLEKIGADGLMNTLEAVRSKLDQPLALGYCNAGRVLELGGDVNGFSIGDRVVSNGRHAEVVVAPQNLCARIPNGVEDESAVFTVLAAIGLQGVRLVNPTLGETVVVTGLGLIGLITVQILRANGCRVLGIDTDPARVALARQFGAEVVDLSQGEDPLAAAVSFSRGRGVDAVILTASTTSSEPVSQAANMCRKRGRIVLVGVTGLELSRADFYEKELSFQVSCSYGPGRYDPAYEEGGQDYPLGFVRWTEQRNFEAALDLMANGALDMKPLISHRFDIDAAAQAYDLLASKAASLGILIRYPATQNRATTPELLKRTIRLAEEIVAPGKAVAGFIGAGNYGGRVLISAFRKAGATLHTLVSAGGVSATHFGQKFGFRQASTDVSAMIADPSIDTVVICTRHDTHALFVQQALAAGKHVFVEKPLCLTLEELEEIATALASRTSVSLAQDVSGKNGFRTRPLLMVGFNRRFAPQVIKMKHLLDGCAEPKSFVMTVNAGAIAADHWTQDPAIGGGRIIGECCHFIDLLRHLAGAPIVRHTAVALGCRSAQAVTSDNASISLEFADGSIGTIHYLANGEKTFPKERLEVFCGGRVLQLDNFRKLRGWGWKGFSRMNLWRQDKGQNACAAAFVRAVRQSAAPPIPLEELMEVSRVTIEVAGALR